MQDSHEDLPTPPSGWEATEESPLKKRCLELANELEDLGFDVSSLVGSTFQIISPMDKAHSDVFFGSLLEYLSQEMPPEEIDKIKEKIAAMKEKEVLILIDEPDHRNLILEKDKNTDSWFLSYRITRQYMRKVKTNLGVYQFFGQIGRRIVKKMKQKE